MPPSPPPSTEFKTKGKKKPQTRAAGGQRAGGRGVAGGGGGGAGSRGKGGKRGGPRRGPPSEGVPGPPPLPPSFRLLKKTQAEGPSPSAPLAPLLPKPGPPTGGGSRAPMPPSSTSSPRPPFSPPGSTSGTPPAVFPDRQFTLLDFPPGLPKKYQRPELHVGNGGPIRPQNGGGGHGCNGKCPRGWKGGDGGESRRHSSGEGVTSAMPPILFPGMRSAPVLLPRGGTTRWSPDNFPDLLPPPARHPFPAAPTQIPPPRLAGPVGGSRQGAPPSPAPPPRASPRAPRPPVPRRALLSACFLAPASQKKGERGGKRGEKRKNDFQY